MGGRSAPPCVNRSPQNNVEVRSSVKKPHSHACGRCGVSNQRTECLPRKKHLSVGKCTRWPIREVANGYHGSNRAAQWYGLRSGHKPFVERAALVGFHMGKRNVAKVLDRQNAAHRFTNQRKHLSRPGVEEQWFIIHDEVLVEREPACAFDHNGRIDAIDPVRNLMHIRPGLLFVMIIRLSLPWIEIVVFRCMSPKRFR